MFNLHCLMIILILVMGQRTAYSQVTCEPLTLSDQQIKEIIDKERAARKGLPPAFPKYEWHVEQQGCYYVYFEYGLPKAMHYEQILKLNQQGVIVDVMTGGNP